MLISADLDQAKVCVCVCAHEYVDIYLNFLKTDGLFKVTHRGSRWWNYDNQFVILCLMYSFN